MPIATPAPADDNVKQAIVEYLRRVPFDRAIEQDEFVALLRRDEALPAKQRLYPPGAVDAFLEARELRKARRLRPTPSAFFSNKSVVVVPGFLGSQLRDDGPADNGLIWIDPLVYFTPEKLSALRLAKYDPGAPDADADAQVHIREDGALPIVYSGLFYYLESGRCEVRVAGFDWRKDLDESAKLLVDTIRSFANEHSGRPFFLIAHSQGSLVARRALQFLGKEEARRIVNRLILLGPASYGTFEAAFAIAGNESLIGELGQFGLEWPADLPDVLQSMSGLYQLLPWKPDTVSMDPETQKNAAFWQTGVDKDRLQKFFKWGASLDSAFFNDRTSIILGDQPDTPDAVGFINGALTATNKVQGDGTVPDKCALIDGVVDVARSPGGVHGRLPLEPSVMQAIWRIITGNLSVTALRGSAPAVAGKQEVVLLPAPVDLFALAGMPRQPPPTTKPTTTAQPAAPAASKQPAPTIPHLVAGYSDAPPTPPMRRLRVFSFDPLLAVDPASLGIASLVLNLEWDDESADGAKLQPGPVGEYLEVIDYDPASRCFYPPVDLNHPNLLAQDGMPLCETDPRFHQQMVYAVGMTTIAIFERALGRVLLWSPHLTRDEHGKVLPDTNRDDGEFIRRLRIYPHAMREANAYYDPKRKSLLFGYFPSSANPGDKVLPHGMIFTCLSYDVVAHEMTHAILDGMHRHMLDASNADVLAFHEAFADIVALFQHFSHPDVVRSQVARVAGKLENESMLGQLAQQFGQAINMHGALRSYLGKTVVENGKEVWKPMVPDPTLYATTTEPHERGAILVAAMFTAFLTIYRSQTRDLLRIASKGTGLLPDGDIHPDLVGRLAHEASKAAQHLLMMAIRALDYVPPVDMTFGDYLRGLITGDTDLVPNDGRFYRVAVVDAFRQWGIYAKHVKNLSVDSLLWSPPESATLKLDMAWFREFLTIGAGNLDLDRADLFHHQRRVQKKMHEWMRERFAENPGLAAEWGLDLSPDAPATIERDEGSPKLPKFDVHSARRCRRIAPDDKEHVDVLIELIQRRAGYFEEAVQTAADAGKPPEGDPDFYFRGGATLIVDPRAGRIRYVIRNSIRNLARFADNRDFYSNHGGALGLACNYFSGPDNPFPHLHGVEE